jgi:outer membrane protein OmpA-like peptidoglycan-associated protein
MKSVIALFVIIAASALVQAQEVIPATKLAQKWRRTKSLAEPKVETRRTKGVELEIIEVKVDADTQERFPNLQFALDSDRLEGDTTFRQLDEIAKAMKMAGNESFLIEGHTCDLGENEHNKTLSQSRAQAVIAYLASKDVPVQRLQALGFGAEQALVANVSESNRMQNRRVQIFRKL